MSFYQVFSARLSTQVLKFLLKIILKKSGGSPVEVRWKSGGSSVEVWWEFEE